MGTQCVHMVIFWIICSFTLRQNNKIIKSQDTLMYADDFMLLTCILGCSARLW